VDVFGRYFRAIAEAGGPVLIHCAAGKDRTGLLVALTQHLLGVSAEDIMADYLLTNEARSLSAWAPRFAELIEREYGRRPPMEAVEAFLRVHPDWLGAAFDEIGDRCGGLDAYLETVLGVDAALKEGITERLLARSRGLQPEA
jgi:protein tyrosine/serine phosphatase